MTATKAQFEVDSPYARRASPDVDRLLLQERDSLAPHDERSSDLSAQCWQFSELEKFRFVTVTYDAKFCRMLWRVYVKNNIRRIRLLDPFVMISTEPLPFDLDKYFNRPPGATEIDLAMLVPIRARMAGIQKARELMRLAGEGRHPKRDPISILRVDEDIFRILDGNSTYAVAKSSNWPRILAIEFNSEVEFLAWSRAKPDDTHSLCTASKMAATDDE
jgi:hypothetical protein